MPRETGYAPERRGLPTELRQAIVGALSLRQENRYRQESAQDQFLRRVAAAIAMFELRRGEPQEDRGLVNMQVDRVKAAADDLKSALMKLPDDVSDVLLDLARRQQSTIADLIAVATAAGDLSEAYRRARGEHDVIPGHSKFLVHLIAEGWNESFGKAAKPTGAFPAVLEEVLKHVGAVNVGRDGLKSILR